MDKYTIPDWDRSILITIDTQNDFTLPDAVASVKGTVDILQNMKQILEQYRKKELPILHVIRLYNKDGSNVDLCRRELIENGTMIVNPGSEGAELVKEIQPKGYKGMDSELLYKGEFQLIGNNEWIMYKARWGAFYKTHLETFLRDRDINTLVFTGCNFPNCPRTSIYEASERDFRIVMIYDAMSQIYEKGKAEMESIGVRLCKSSEVSIVKNKN